jgi:DNA invertase Pin-like site-specific DNA recombinase
MTSAGTTHEETAAPAAAAPAAAVLYVCAERGKLNTGLAAERAEEEGNAFAQEHGLTIVETVQDEYGEPDPCRRPGWQRVRELVESGATAVVIMRWPACLAPERSHDLRHREVRWLRQCGVRVRYSWAPLAKSGGEAK